MTPESMPPLFHTGHMVHFLNRPLGEIYTYDPTDDGPECEVITRILARYPLYVPGLEKQVIQSSRHLEAASLVLFGKSFKDIGEERRTIVRDRVTQALVSWGLE